MTDLSLKRFAVLGPAILAISLVGGCGGGNSAAETDSRMQDRPREQATAIAEEPDPGNRRRAKQSPGRGAGANRARDKTGASVKRRKAKDQKTRETREAPRKDPIDRALDKLGQGGGSKSRVVSSPEEISKALEELKETPEQESGAGEASGLQETVDQILDPGSSSP